MKFFFVVLLFSLPKLIHANEASLFGPGSVCNQVLNVKAGDTNSITGQLAQGLQLHCQAMAIKNSIEYTSKEVTNKFCEKKNYFSKIDSTIAGLKDSKSSKLMDKLAIVKMVSTLEGLKEKYSLYCDNNVARNFNPNALIDKVKTAAVKAEANVTVDDGMRNPKDVGRKPAVEAPAEIETIDK